MARSKDDKSAFEAAPTPHVNVVARNISTEMRESYLDYAMTVITSRALPDVRDGLKPVHRRILYTMGKLGLTANAKTRKSATVVGEVMGKLHPHGDSAIYESMVKMAQDFTMRYPLVIGQGNFGSIDGDGAAAMRYTESKLSRLGNTMLDDIEKETVAFAPNYDNTEKEPTVLPAAAPNLLLNGTLGIAVGMATNIPPHNLREVCGAAIHLIENPEATTEDLMKFVQGPDFPTGCMAFNQKDIVHAYTTGRGPVVVRGDAEITEGKKGDYQIIVTSIPYRVNKSDLLIKMADLVHEKKLEGIRDIRDAVNKDIEVLRAEGKVGSSLQANVALTVSTDDHALLASLGDDLKFVFITSAIDLIAGDALSIRASASNAIKCERCWPYRDDIGVDPAHPTLCGRCTSNLFGAGEARAFA